MEDELRLFLLLGGSVFIIGVLAHGIWKIRNNSKPEEKQRLEPRQWDENDDEYTESRDDSGFDELGIGSVRVVGDSPNSEPASDSEQNKASTDFSNEENRQSLSSDHLASDYLANGGSSYASEKEDSADTDTTDGEKNSAVIATPAEENPDSQEQRSTLYGSVITNPKPHIKNSSRHAVEPATLRNDNIADFPEPPDFLLRDSETSEDTESSMQAETSGQADSSVDDSSLPEISTSETSASTHKSSHDATTPSNTDANSTTAPTKSVPRSEVPKATSTLYVDATRDEAENAGARVEPIFSDPLNNESYDEKPQGRQRLSKTRRSKSPARKREEPNFGDDQMRIDFDDSESQASSAGASAPKESSSSNSSDSPAQEVLVLNVRAPNDAPISGAALLPMLLTLGFKFGDQDIFHRHVNSNGKGPVLFSLANMFKPGVFDIDNLENFDTQGVSLFMILPIEGDPHQVFNMMHNAARKLADEFNAQVLDGRRSVLTKQGLQQYVEKIREFERRRMISRS
ncbi:cell division protein ZipA [Alteromonas hispanica]|uniref:Cell division protein ZipA n=1 Tax=Alteromonas hispanica TaxID=315421 RepID=A0A6L9MPM7_9ALTE|nr:cell division protein ZipA [Alteromonas hispanica]NDW20162.1 cell division protein ZipA [Alteromonas hispanica]